MDVFLKCKVELCIDYHFCALCAYMPRLYLYAEIIYLYMNIINAFNRR